MFNGCPRDMVKKKMYNLYLLYLQNGMTSVMMMRKQLKRVKMKKKS